MKKILLLFILVGCFFATKGQTVRQMNQAGPLHKKDSISVYQGRKTSTSGTHTFAVQLDTLAQLLIDSCGVGSGSCCDSAYGSDGWIQYALSGKLHSNVRFVWTLFDFQSTQVSGSDSSILSNTYQGTFSSAIDGSSNSSTFSNNTDTDNTWLYFKNSTGFQTGIQFHDSGLWFINNNHLTQWTAQWPKIDGANGLAIITDGHGHLSFGANSLQQVTTTGDTTDNPILIKGYVNFSQFTGLKVSNNSNMGGGIAQIEIADTTSGTESGTAFITSQGINTDINMGLSSNSYIVLDANSNTTSNTFQIDDSIYTANLHLSGAGTGVVGVSSTGAMYRTTGGGGSISAPLNQIIQGTGTGTTSYTTHTLDSLNQVYSLGFRNPDGTRHDFIYINGNVTSFANPYVFIGDSSDIYGCAAGTGSGMGMLLDYNNCDIVFNNPQQTIFTGSLVVDKLGTGSTNRIGGWLAGGGLNTATSLITGAGLKISGDSLIATGIGSPTIQQVLENGNVTDGSIQWIGEEFMQGDGGGIAIVLDSTGYERYDLDHYSNPELFGKGISNGVQNNFGFTNTGFITIDSIPHINSDSVLVYDHISKKIGKKIISSNAGTITSIATTSPITGGTITTTGTIGITQATTSTNGYLSSTDWNAFNGKVSDSAIAVTSPIVAARATGKVTLSCPTCIVTAITDSGHFAGTGISISRGANKVTITNTKPDTALFTSAPITITRNINGNTIGLTTPLSATYGGTGLNTSSSTGVVQVLSGTYSVTPTLANGTSSTTQTAGDNTGLNATDAFVTTAINNALAGVNPATAVQAASTIALPAVTCNNGVSGIGATLTANSGGILTQDGYTPALGDRLLEKNQATASQNGIYTITTLGTSLIPFVLTRATDFNSTSDINSTGAIPVINGTVNAVTQWVVSSTITSVACSGAGTSITFTQFSANPANNITTSTSAGGDLTGTYPNPTIKASVALTGTPTVPTASATTNTTQAASTAMVQSAVATRISVNRAYSSTAAALTGTTTVTDGTAFTNTEGTQFLAATITPLSATDTLVITVNFPSVKFNSSPAGCYMGLFQDATTNALTAVHNTFPNTSFYQPIALQYEVAAGTTSATTFKVRIGSNTAGTVSVNDATMNTRASIQIQEFTK